MKILLMLLGIIFLLIVFAGAIPAKKPDQFSKAGVDWVKKESEGFITATENLKTILSHINAGDSVSIITAKESLKKCRLRYKRISFFMEYYFPGVASICNGPLKVDLDDDEPLEPVGMQVIESYLYQPHPWKYKKEFTELTDVISHSVRNIVSVHKSFNTEDKSFLESLRLELIRVMALYIEGFDAPQLKSGIEEAYESLSAIDIVLQPYLKDVAQKDSIEYYFTQGKNYLEKDPGFDSFDRLFFITNYALPLQRYLNELNKAGRAYGANTALNIRAKNLFTADALNKNAFPHLENLTDPLMSKLGKQLFFEKSFSQNGKRSCATCHDPKKFFTDGLTRNKVLDESSVLARNTPTLLYSYLQHSQFWDGRAESLEKQVHTVLTTGHEMNVDETVLLKKLQTDPSYASQFKKIWPKENNPVNFQHATSALAAFIQTLSPFSSDFDRYMQGDKTALTSSQKRGFNLFMGKAACGTCHFAPVFNGLVPPNYTTTEFEILGTPMNEDLEKPIADTDLGMYNVFEIEQFKGAFKTPTIRNAAKTAPYMHNGAFSTLEKVIDFYDKGGGAGIGLNIPQQTLSSTPLNLTKEEKTDLISFIEALTDKAVL
jgi:cytochrome c peroxidase